MADKTISKMRIREMLGFYENELVQNILFFWDEKCIDRVNGGFFNCFDNRGDHLVSRDKYTWSQGRFVWLFAKLSTMEGGTFTKAQRAEFLANAKQGAAFLRKHCLLSPGDWRCAFLMDETGRHKTVEGWGNRLDLSLSADGFVVTGLARYAQTAHDEESYRFAKALYLSVKDRYDRNDYLNLPYPLNPKYRAHGKPMGLTHTAQSIYDAALLFEPDWAETVAKAHLRSFTEHILEHFVDDDYTLREIVAKDGTRLPSVLGRHMNPGHTIEGMWFMMDSMDTNGEATWLQPIAGITKKALENGWDDEFGGLLHFCGINGGAPEGDTYPDADEPMMKQLLSGWGDKLWWIHSEALYTTMRLYQRTGDAVFWEWYEKLFDYTLGTFPNPDREVREWIQIRKRDGSPQDKVVALPVKDPYHIMRNFILMVELLSAMLRA